MTRPTQEWFRELHDHLRGYAFDIQNQFGRLMDEQIYQRELSRRLEKDGFDARQEVRMTLLRSRRHEVE